MTTEKNILIPMRDGTLLATNVFRPDTREKVPVLAARTPYNKDGIKADIDRFVGAGYAVAVQDVRGRYASEGEFSPYTHETDDGLDFFGWLLAQDWCDGNIGTFGGSYLGGTQWLPARMSPAGLRAMVPEVTFDDLYFGCMYQGDAKVLHDLRWMVADIIPEAARRAAQRGEPEIELPDVDSALQELPMASHPALNRFGTFYRDWLDHATVSEFWRRYSPKSGYEGVSVPALNISGWYDIFVPSTLNNYAEMKRRGGSEAARNRQRLIMGPWSHMNFSGAFPEMCYGESASADAIDLAGIKIDWYDRWLKGVESPGADERPVKIFVMGINRWRDELDWPLPNTEYRPFYLHSGGAANTLNGDGALSEEKPRAEKADSYTYDPMDPAPTIGGQVILPGENAIGPRDQREAEMRSDVLVYSLPVLEKAIEVTGTIQLKLFASSDSPDTDFTAKLVDVFPDGRAMILTDGILRTRYRESFEMPKLLHPGEIYELTVEMGATANVFLPGHRVRLEISSSNFPKFNRNSNTGGDIARESREAYKPAVNTVYHDERHPTRLILPITPEDRDCASVM